MYTKHYLRISHKIIFLKFSINTALSHYLQQLGGCVFLQHFEHSKHCIFKDNVLEKKLLISECIF